jgi:hypothetical protein
MADGTPNIVTCAVSLSLGFGKCGSAVIAKSKSVFMWRNFYIRIFRNQKFVNGVTPAVNRFVARLSGAGFALVPGLPHSWTYSSIVWVAIVVSGSSSVSHREPSIRRRGSSIISCIYYPAFPIFQGPRGLLERRWCLRTRFLNEILGLRSSEWYLIRGRQW